MKKSLDDVLSSEHNRLREHHHKKHFLQDNKEPIFFLSLLAVLTLFLFITTITYSSPYTSLSGFATHSQFFEFSAPEGRMKLINSQFSSNDSLVHRTAYFSVNGSSWQSFELSGDSFSGDDLWLVGTTTYTLPENMSGRGEHYIIVFSCEILADSSLDCHNSTNHPDGFWQLFVINNTLDTPFISPSSPIIVNHTTTNISLIPLTCIEKAKAELHIAYAHTSHGSQIYDGLRALASYDSLYSYSQYGGPNDLHFEDYYGYASQSGFATGGCYDLSNCDNGGEGILAPTRMYLDDAINYPLGQDINVIMWSWCSINGHNIPFYLDKMQTLILEYENGTYEHPLPLRFVFMTGHTEGRGVDGPVHTRNEQIRDFITDTSPDAFCQHNDCILFDFADIEEYNPDNEYFTDDNIDENLAYAGGNWGTEYLANYPSSTHADITALVPACAHSSSPYGANLNCALKGQAAWHLFARLAGWDGDPASTCS